MPTSQKPTVRERYQYACGYCGVSEAHAGGELTIDHFQPRSIGGGEDADNLSSVVDGGWAGDGRYCERTD